MTKTDILKKILREVEKNERDGLENDIDFTPAPSFKWIKCLCENVIHNPKSKEIKTRLFLIITIAFRALMELE